MSQLTARLLLGVSMAAGIVWTIIAVNTVGREWVTSRLLRMLIEAEPILIGLWCLFYVGCTWSLTRTEAEMFDLLLIIACWATFGHICWRLG